MRELVDFFITYSSFSEYDCRRGKRKALPEKSDRAQNL
jgi:hypothetical protein